MKRILVVSNLFPSKNDPTFGTFVKHFYDEACEYLQDVRIEKCVIAGRSKTALEKVFKYIKFYTECFLKLLFHKYDLIYIHYISHSIPPVWLASKFKKLEIAFNIHGDDLLVRSKQGEFFLRKAGDLLPKSKMVVVPSVFFKDILQESFPNITEEQIIVSASGGIDESFFFPNNLSRRTSNVINLGYVSRVDLGKGWDVYVRAIKRLKQDGISINGVVIGAGRQVTEMNGLIAEQNLQDVIQYLGPKTHAELPSIYRELDLFVFPTMLLESLGLVGLEAMASCTPVVGSDIGGLRTYIEDEINGYLFEAGDAEELALKIEQYINLDQGAKIKMRLSALDTAKRYEAKKVSKDLFNRLSEIYNIKMQND